MKLTAAITTQVIELVCRLPGVPTQDWCQRASDGLARVHSPCVTLCALGQADPRGFISKLHLVGASCSPDYTKRGGTGLTNGELGHTCEQIVENEWLGWNVGTLEGGSWFVTTATQQGLMPGRGPSALNRRWEWLTPVDVLLGAVVIPGAPGRMLFVEIASSDPNVKESNRQLAVLAASLPLLSQRITKAFGEGIDDRKAWLTPREELVMWHLVAGRKVPQIAALLHRSIYTVHDHVKSLHRKLQANNRGQLVARALGHLSLEDMAGTALSDAEAAVDASDSSPHTQHPPRRTMNSKPRVKASEA
ncbi:hypothetical protein BH11PLA1_BH11PLA1_19910 [soil metagenome]